MNTQDIVKLVHRTYYKRLGEGKLAEVLTGDDLEFALEGYDKLKAGWGWPSIQHGTSRYVTTAAQYYQLVLDTIAGIFQTPMQLTDRIVVGHSCEIVISGSCNGRFSRWKPSKVSIRVIGGEESFPIEERARNHEVIALIVQALHKIPVR